MDKNEGAQREAEHKAAGLHKLGWETGAGAAIWARAVRDVLALHESTRERYAANTADRETWERLHATALMLVVAVDQILTFELRVRRLTGDAELQKARARFDVVGADAEGLRDLIAHLDEYAIGKGQRQTGKLRPTLDDPYLETFIYWSDGGGTIVNLGDQQLDLRAAAEAAIELAQVVERVQVKRTPADRTPRERDSRRRKRQAGPPLRGGTPPRRRPATAPPRATPSSRGVSSHTRPGQSHRPRSLVARTCRCLYGTGTRASVRERR